jgi:hypothetical protein
MLGRQRRWSVHVSYEWLPVNDEWFVSLAGGQSRRSLGSGLMYVDAAPGPLYLDRLETTPRDSADWRTAAAVLEAADLRAVPDVSAVCRKR